MSPAPRLLDQVREAARVRHLSYRTEQAYVAWIRRFIVFHGRRHPAGMGGPEVEAFLTHLASDRNVAAATQNQALSALLFLYQQVLGQETEYEHIKLYSATAKEILAWIQAERAAISTGAGT